MDIKLDSYITKLNYAANSCIFKTQPHVHTGVYIATFLPLIAQKHEVVHQQIVSAMILEKLKQKIHTYIATKADAFTTCTCTWYLSTYSSIATYTINIIAQQNSSIYTYKLMNNLQLSYEFQCSLKYHKIQTTGSHSCI